MKKNVPIIILFLIITVYLFLYQDIISIIVIDASILFLKKVLTFLLPFYIISKVLINYNFAYYIAKLFNNNIYVFILIISFFTGCPNNILTIKELLEKKIITTNQANKYIKCSFFNNPLFLYNMISNIFNKKIALIIIFIQLLSNIIIYLIKPCKNNNIIYLKSDSLLNVLNNSLKEISFILLNIYITIILFNILIIFIPNIFNNFIGLIELTTGLNYLINTNINFTFKLILTIIYISFGGFSIHMQIKSVLIDTNISYKNFLISRIYQIIISLLITIICSYTLGLQ